MVFGENRYLKIAKSTSAFNPLEVEVLKEVLTDCFENPKTTYILFEEVGGFTIFGRSPMTKFSWDIYWTVVDKDFQRRGIGKKLQGRVEDYILKQDKKANLRVETSSKPAYDATRDFYKSIGFKEIGRIPDFYNENDSLVIFYKEICACLYLKRRRTRLLE